MTERKLNQIQNRIKKIKQELLEIGEMRPGALSKQYKTPKKKEGAYYQLSYTHEMKSRTEYVRPSFVKQIKEETKSYKKFKRLVDSWIKLSIEYSRLKMLMAIKLTEK